jgi:hypothetical protein
MGEKDNQDLDNLYNQIEEALMPDNSGDDKGEDVNERLVKLEEDKNEIVKQFLSSDLQKTEISKSERKLLPLLKIIADNPFPTLTKHRPEKQKEMSIPALSEFVDKYLKLGIPLNRKGRKEDVKILQSMYSQPLELQEEDEGEGRFKNIRQ